MPTRNSLEVQWLGLHVSTARGLGLIPGQATKFLQAALGAAKKINTTKQTKQTTEKTHAHQFFDTLLFKRWSLFSLYLSVGCT